MSCEDSNIILTCIKANITHHWQVCMENIILRWSQEQEKKQLWVGDINWKAYA